MRSFILTELILLSILMVLSFGGMALNDSPSMPMNMTMPMNMSMPMNMKMPMSMPMNMPNKMANGSMNMIMLQNVTVNIILIQNLTEISNVIIPAIMEAANRNTTDII